MFHLKCICRGDLANRIGIRTLSGTLENENRFPTVVFYDHRELHVTQESCLSIGQVDVCAGLDDKRNV